MPRFRFCACLIVFGLGGSALGCGSGGDDDEGKNGDGASGQGTGGTSGTADGSASGGKSAGSGGKSSGTGAVSGEAGSGASAGTGGAPSGDGKTYGSKHAGQYHLGPVDFAETEWHNACAPGGFKYRDELHRTTGLEGEYLVGVANQFADAGGACDACVLIETGSGRSLVARVVTYGVEQDQNDIDVSPSVFEALHTGEFPRSATWTFARCPDTGKLQYEFQTAANPYWTSLWVRNPRVPLSKLEVKSKNHANFAALTRGPDGSLTDAGGFGEGEFTLRLTAMDGQVITETLPKFSAGALERSGVQFE